MYHSSIHPRLRSSDSPSETRSEMRRTFFPFDLREDTGDREEFDRRPVTISRRDRAPDRGVRCHNQESLNHQRAAVDQWLIDEQREVPRAHCKENKRTFFTFSLSISSLTEWLLQTLEWWNCDQNAHDRSPNERQVGIQRHSPWPPRYQDCRSMSRRTDLTHRWYCSSH